ncbi:histidinol dehydrogenase [Kangiella koreensis]|uniref:Histidinol dehydrogenase n=1 Tax=Kangiella koreensis (strain DSM 16069 / JCM 12317 / KCTC 12182 / SW-125) TaxID=523791 RepID=C7RAI8_KANKD|nr:histidinol dehydrogenase [Kangiella koreensis]ACV26280.1 histidinol dehydrogenase [Kangiella koreensis DSM 16069]
MADKSYIECASNWKRPNLTQSPELFQQVAKLLKEIETGGDLAIDNLSKRFDGFQPRKIELRPYRDYELEPQLLNSIEQAAQRIEAFCQLQKGSLQPQQIEEASGVFGFQYSPIEAIGAYIPGGRFPLISTALMTLIPARVAGCQRRVACSPSVHPAILAAASLAGATEFWQIGGAQAVAAMAYGYQTMLPVQMVVGPGNQYVNVAKQLLQSRIKIDVAAGPSELLILADSNANQEWLIADMAAQAEHDPQAQSVLVSDDIAFLQSIGQQLTANDELNNLLKGEQIVLLQANDCEAMIRFSNRYAPEHLLLADERIASQSLKHYGSLFIGQNSAVAFGDYCAGPNHTLPTMGSANRSSGLCVQSFMNIQSYQQINDQGRIQLAEIGRPLAEAEQLVWHERSMQVRS